MPTDDRPRALMCELDGVLASVEWRAHHLDAPDERHANWDAYYGGIPLDPCVDAARLALTQVPPDIEVVICTSRSGAYRRATEAWLASHRIRYDLLAMRYPKDHRPPATTKAHLYTQLVAPFYTITAVYESDPACIEMWTAQGLSVLAVRDPFLTPALAPSAT